MYCVARCPRNCRACVLDPDGRNGHTSNGSVHPQRRKHGAAPPRQQHHREHFNSSLIYVYRLTSQLVDPEKAIQ
jgi:hypothetical protein